MADMRFLNNLAFYFHLQQFWHTPYDTGNLAASIGDVGRMDGYDSAVGYYMFDRNSSAPYGAMLNENASINHWVTDLKTGQRFKVAYKNKHYMWVDKAMDSIFNDACVAFNLRRV